MIQRITSRQNPLVQQVRRLLNSRRAREEAGLFVTDGVKLLPEAAQWGDWLDTVILTEPLPVKIPDGVRNVYVSHEIMTYLSPMESPQGAILVCKMPPKDRFVPQRGMLLLDGLQDPGNVGTIVRTADALGVPIALLENCADLYSHKTVRASMGAIFRTKIPVTTWDAAYRACRDAGIPVGATALSPRATDIRLASPADMVVVIGSEGQGIRQEILTQADAELIIPMQPKCESLNAAVAAAIVMWQMVR